MSVVEVALEGIQKHPKRKIRKENLVIRSFKKPTSRFIKNTIVNDWFFFQIWHFEALNKF